MTPLLSSSWKCYSLSQKCLWTSRSSHIPSGSAQQYLVVARVPSSSTRHQNLFLLAMNRTQATWGTNSRLRIHNIGRLCFYLCAPCHLLLHSPLLSLYLVLFNVKTFIAHPLTPSVVKYTPRMLRKTRTAFNFLFCHLRALIARLAYFSVAVGASAVSPLAHCGVYYEGEPCT